MDFYSEFENHATKHMGIPHWNAVPLMGNNYKRVYITVMVSVHN
jgi:hypothetical protein